MPSASASVLVAVSVSPSRAATAPRSTLVVLVIESAPVIGVSRCTTGADGALVSDSTVPKPSVIVARTLITVATSAATSV